MERCFGCFVIIAICVCSLTVVADSHCQSRGFLFELSNSGNKRTAFVRMEKQVQLLVDITNDTGHDLSDVIVKSKCDDKEIQSTSLSSFQNKETKTLHIPVDTTVRPGKYVYGLSATAQLGDTEAATEHEIPIIIVKRKLPHKMPLVLWSTTNSKLTKKLGFTHCFQFTSDNLKIWLAKSPTVANSPVKPVSPQAAYLLDKVYSILNEALVDDIGIISQIAPHSYNNHLSPYYRIDRAGKWYPSHGENNLCGLFKEIQDYYYNVGASVAQTYGEYPSLSAAIINTEIRDHANLCFHPHDRKAYKDYSGKDIPENVKNKYGVSYSTLEQFPAKHIIPDDDAILSYLKWYWQKGDGWNTLTTLAHRGLKSTGRDDLWTFTDPAIRVPSISGSGGEVDYINQWTYSYPDPIKIGKATDELLAMTSLSETPQGVFKMTQAIWYRSGSAPTDDGIEKTADWEKQSPNAAYITIAPDALREAFWSKISRGIRGIMYHGLGSIMERGAKSWGYVHTNPKTKIVIKELADKVVTPLGPTLLQIPESNSDIAFLQSFASQMYAGVGEYGWGWGWESDAYEMLRYAHLQPRVVFEEHITQGALDDVRVLVMMNCPVLTQTVADKINEFQRNGGLIVSDEHVCFGISPDVLLHSYSRSGKDAFAGKELIQGKAKEFRRVFDDYYVRYVESDNDDVLVRIRRYQNTDYVFTINDNRTFGDYVGHHKIVMEKGLPSNATVSLHRDHGYVYDLTTNSEVAPTQSPGTLAFPVTLGPGGGSVFMITEQKIDSIHLDITGSTCLGNEMEIAVRILDKHSEPLEAVIPCHLEIIDPAGDVSEFSGHYGAKDGKIEIRYSIAENDLAGQWIVVVKELASGIQGSHSFYVTDSDKATN